MEEARENAMMNFEYEIVSRISARVVAKASGA